MVHKQTQFKVIPEAGILRLNMYEVKLLALNKLSNSKNIQYKHVSLVKQTFYSKLPNWEQNLKKCN